MLQEPRESLRESFSKKKPPWSNEAHKTPHISNGQEEGLISILIIKLLLLVASCRVHIAHAFSVAYFNLETAGGLRTVSSNDMLPMIRLNNGEIPFLPRCSQVYPTPQLLRTLTLHCIVYRESARGHSRHIPVATGSILLSW